MSKLKLPGKTFAVIDIVGMEVSNVKIIPPSIWVKERNPMRYSDMDKQECELFDELFPWKVIFADKVMWIQKKKLGILLEKYEETE